MAGFRRPNQLDWSIEALRAVLGRLDAQLDLEVWGELDSTNTQLLGRLRDGSLNQPLWLVAEHQTAGRGRLGRVWETPPGTALCASLAWPLATSQWSGLSLAVGVALAQALDPLPANPPELGLKWPNDLWLRRPGAANGYGKLAGILIESVVAQGQRWAVVGMGVNVHPIQIEGNNQAVSLREWADSSASRGLPKTAPEVLARIAPAVTRALQTFESRGFAAFAEGFSQRDVLRGQWIHTTWSVCPEGKACGVDALGELQVLDALGHRHTVASGEVSVRPRNKPDGAITA